MGFLDDLFGAETITSVSSVAYNLAGEEAGRPDYLKSLVASNVLGSNKFSMGETISSGYLKGPGIRLRHIPAWSARTGYDGIVGLSTGTIKTGDSIDDAVLIAEIPHAVDETVQLQRSSISRADFTYWAEQYVLTNHPKLYNTAWVADYIESTGEIKIIYVDLSEDTFTPTDFDANSQYLYASYVLTKVGTAGLVTTGTVIFLGSGDPFPSTTGWDNVAGVWVKETYKGQATDGDYTYSLKELMYFDTTARSYRIDTQIITHKIWLPMQYLIYKCDSGNVNLDAMFSDSTSMGDFFPFVPIRLDNKFVSDSFLPDAYAGGKKVLKKAVNANLDDLIAKVEDNPSLSDIDYAYVVFGVSLNVEENACRKYLYHFFKALQQEQPTADAIGDWEAAMALSAASVASWKEWNTTQYDNPLASLSEPEVIPYPALPSYSLQVTSQDRPVMNYDMLIQWSGIKEETGFGLKIPTAKRGDLWFEISTTDSYAVDMYSLPKSSDDGVISVTPVTVEHIFLHWQETNNSWRSLKISGLKHRNMIYNGVSVNITAAQALNDTDESGFIIPLHAEIYSSMPLIDGTQMSTACCFIVFNCYTEVKEKWYQTDLFKIVIFAVQAIYYGLPTALATLAATKAIEVVAVAVFGEKLAGTILAIANVILIVNGNVPADGSSATTYANMMRAENLLKLTMAVGDGVSAYLKASANEVMLDTQNMMQDYESKMSEVQKLFEQNIGYSQGLIDPMQLTNSTRSAAESLDSFLGRTLMTGTEIAELSTSMLSRFAELTLSTDLPT